MIDPAFGALTLEETSHLETPPKDQLVISHKTSLTLEQVLTAAREFRFVSLAPECEKMLAHSRAALELRIAAHEVIYGVNTGFGGNSKYLIPPDDLTLHQENLLSFLSAGTGPTLPIEIVRIAMLARANALSRGWSAVRPAVVKLLLDFFNRGITPVVPRWGSVGASGDLVPSAHIARCLIGQGQVFYKGEVISASEALRREGLRPLKLKAKEGLALVNGTTMMSGVAVHVVIEAKYLFTVALGAIALAVEALRSSPDYYDPRTQAIKNHPGQIGVAAFLRSLLEGSQLAVSLEDIRRRIALTTNRAHGSHSVEVATESVQSPYSLRCIPQGLGPIWETLQQTQVTIEREINSANDNPLVDPASGDILHTGNFYGSHVARVMDGTKIDLCNLSNWLHSLMGLLMDSRFSNGLPDSLSPQVGLYQGFKGVQLSHSSSVTAIRHLCAPSSIHTLPTEQFNQDVVSLGTHAALTALDITMMLRDVVSMTLLAVVQAIDLRAGAQQLGDGTRPIYKAVRRVSRFVQEDRALDRDIVEVSALIGRRGIPMPELFQGWLTEQE